MHLEIADFPVREVVFGPATGYRDGVLTVDVDELRAVILADSRFEDVGIALAVPGDSVRIHNVVDVVEPRVRAGDPGSDFPGILSAPLTVGAGRTHRLSGLAVTEVSEPVRGESVYWRTAIIDMAGPVQRLSPFGAVRHLVLTFRPRAGAVGDDADGGLNVLAGTPQAMEYNFAVRKAGLKAAAYLAEPVRDRRPDGVTSYDLSLPANSGLPRIVYVCQAYGLYAYGSPTAGPEEGGPAPLPTVIHPNEVLDGALVNMQTWPACHRDVTYFLQNHPVIEELYRRHGSELEFRGVVLHTEGESKREKERMSSYAANLALMLRAEGAILTYLGSGHSLVEVMMTCQKLEQQGVRTTILLPEMAADGDNSGLVYSVPEADAMVSTGNYEEAVTFPAVERVLGGDVLFETGEQAARRFTLPLRAVLSSTDPLGSGVTQGVPR